jgi:Trk-type K+ transport system membrane component
MNSDKSISPVTGQRLTNAELKEKEMLLWDEIRDLRGVALKMLQWGVTVLAALQTALFFLRKDLYERMIENQELQKGQMLPWSKYIFGTFFLTFVALLFYYLLSIVATYYRKVREELVENNYFNVEHGSVGKPARFALAFVFLAFPILDICIRIYIQIKIGLK